MMKRNAFFLLLVFCLACMTGAVSAETPQKTEGIEIPVITDIKEFEIPDNDAMAFVKDMKLGWNLGNTFDAYDTYTKTVQGTAMETIWVGSGAVTTDKLIATLQEAGFHTIRIPVSWHNHVDTSDRIDEQWMARVRQVADYALNRGMYVIVNVHHDNDVRYFYPDPAHIKRSREYLTAVWQQMAETFADCDDHLILESMNEPRLVGTEYEWYWTDSISDCRIAARYINELNQLFVDTVRATGGNNATRYLAVPAYCAAPANATNPAFMLPEDTAENRIIVSVHAYTPYNFALNLKDADHTFDIEKDYKKTSEISTFMNQLYSRFIKNGIPVVIDEFGALEKQGNLQDRVNFAAFYTAAASARGMTCCWWDNHAFTGNGERFGLIKRYNCTWTYPDIVLAMDANCLYNRKAAE